jgi:nicotinamidase-related amidase
MSSTPLKTALLVIDLQKEFAESVQAAGSLPQVLQLSKYFLDRNLPQVFIQDTDEGRELDSDNFKLLPAVEEAYHAIEPPAPLLVKTVMDAFVETPLEQILKDEAVERVVVVGYATNQCCTATGTTAKSKFETWFVEDATAADSKAEHDDAVSAFAAAGGVVKNMQDVIDLLEHEKGV